MSPLPAPLWLRTFIGFLIAPVSPAVVIVCLGFLASGPSRHIGTILMALALYGYSVALVGIPLYAVLRWRGWNGWQTYLLAGPLLGIGVLIAALTIVGRSLSWLLEIGKFSLIFLFVAGCGLVAAMCFWWIVRPDCSGERAEPAPAA